MNAPISARTSVIARKGGLPSIGVHQWPRSFPHPARSWARKRSVRQLEHGSKIERIEGMLCRTYWEKETYEWGHILYELRLDMVTAHPVTWTVTDVYPEEKHLTAEERNAVPGVQPAGCG